MNKIPTQKFHRWAVAYLDMVFFGVWGGGVILPPR